MEKEDFIKKVGIRPAKRSDIKILNKYLPVNIPQFHEQKIKEQEKENNIWLIAWYNQIPIGHIQIRFNGCEIKKVKKKIKNCGHIESLSVNKKLRGKGVALKLMDFSEKLIKKKGLDKAGLSIEENNSFLIILYTKMGYKDSGLGPIIERWYTIDKKRNKKLVKQKCNYFIKSI